jgi:co-chaperonin GroES (HSP10)
MQMLKPIYKRLLVRLEPIETKSAGGIILATDERRQKNGSEKGTILAVSEDCFTEYEGLPKVGDQIYFAKYAGKFVVDPDTGEELVLLNDEDVVAIISRNEGTND